MASIDALIFSKDRPAQLDLLLRSMAKHTRGLYRTVTILHTWTAVDYLRGYEVCRKEHPGVWISDSELRFAPLRWLPEVNFEWDVRAWLAGAYPNVSFLVDDDVFYRDAEPPGELPWSFRGGDYDYPFSVDGNVYRKADVLTLIEGMCFDNPTALEALAHLRRKRLSFAVVNHGDPCLVGIPANRVSVSSGMPHAGQHEYDLNERYLAGERLALPEPAGDLAAHAEIPLVFA